MSLNLNESTNTIESKMIPACMKNRKQWIMWRYEQRDANAKPTKVPYQTNGLKAKTNDLSTWATFDECTELLLEDEFDGIGFVFSEGDNLAGIDLDHCFDIW